MAVMTLDFYSKSLKMSTIVTIILPDSIRMGNTPISQRKCLYLLHGLSDNASSCLRLSKVELYAQEAGIIVVMPSAGRSMYCDNVLGQHYFSFISEELPEYLGALLGLSRKRELLYIAGISMGGMGAARIALTNPERFTAVGLFSGLLDLKLMLPYVTEEQKQEFPFLMDAASDIESSPLNPLNLLDESKHQGLHILVRCGFQDDLFHMSCSFAERAKALNLNVTTMFEDGAHEWRLWDRYIEDFIAMMEAE